ncbi:hypothetical protein CQZ93_14515 [Ochrobactrum vermis]|nr:hypothetical protein CQZ93_14515 [Ochrobactrum vermis]
MKRRFCKKKHDRKDHLSQRCEGKQEVSCAVGNNVEVECSLFSEAAGTCPKRCMVKKMVIKAATAVTPRTQRN